MTLCGEKGEGSVASKLPWLWHSSLCHACASASLAQCRSAVTDFCLERGEKNHILDVEELEVESFLFNNTWQ